jgi:fused signal recognition particle receptor
MFDFLKRKKTLEAANQPVLDSPSSRPQQDTESLGLFNRLKQGLSKTRTSLTNKISALFLGKKELNVDLLNEIEMILLTADVGIETTEQLIQHLTKQLARNELNNADIAIQALKKEMRHILQPCYIPLSIPAHIKPYVILVIGINGSGKTTTIGKLAFQFTQNHKKVMLAAGDTFRAAAIEQLQIWGQRNHIPVIAQQAGADTAAVIYDSMEAAKARGVDILLADTAGRLHTQAHLMNELQKIKRVIKKMDETAPHETLIVLDATLGQNALNQVKQFNDAIGVTGIALTKLDGTAKGGIIFTIAKQTGIPIRYIGIGENIDDLRPFNADEFIDALFTE